MIVFGVDFPTLSGDRILSRNENDFSESSTDDPLLSRVSSCIALSEPTREEEFFKFYISETAGTN
jgi:hypothetical protein